MTLLTAKVRSILSIIRFVPSCFCGNVNQLDKLVEIIEELKRNRDKTTLSKSAKDLLNKTITYFTNHQHKMDYKTYLERGLPVNTALVESSCGRLVKDRMERSGMRWSLNGAQNMMDIRAVKKNGDWAEFMDYILFRSADCPNQPHIVDLGTRTPKRLMRSLVRFRGI